jgi:hypothetical protein
MADKYPPAVQRLALLELVKALGCRDNALRRDECSDWRINGRQGHIYAVPEGFQIMVMGWTTKGWNAAKKALTFAKVTQDGDEEGGVLLNRLPSAAEAVLIRHWVGIAKKMEFSEEYRTELRARALKARQQIGRGPASRLAEPPQAPRSPGRKNLPT